MNARSIIPIVLVSLLATIAVGCSKSSTAPEEIDLTCESLLLAPDSLRVDVVPPTFSNPTSVTKGSAASGRRRR